MVFRRLCEDIRELLRICNWKTDRKSDENGIIKLECMMLIMRLIMATWEDYLLMLKWKVMARVLSLPFNRGTHTLLQVCWIVYITELF